jgi:hypothetical protein
MAEPKKIIVQLARLRALKTFASPDAVNTTTSPQLPKASWFVLRSDDQVPLLRTGVYFHIPSGNSINRASCKLSVAKIGPD